MPAKDERRETIRVIRAYFMKIGLPGPTLADTHHVLDALEEAGLLHVR